MTRGMDKALQKLGTVDGEERAAFISGLARAYEAVFGTFSDVLQSRGDIHTALDGIRSEWDQIRGAL